MGNYEQLINWVLERRKDLSFLVTEMSLPKRFNFHDYKTNMEYKGISFVGRGTSYDKNEALVKSIAECLERIAAYTNGYKNTNGIAAHFSYSEAFLAARNELIERGSFLGCFYSRSSLNKIDSTDLISMKTKKIVNWLHQKGVTTNFYEKESFGIKTIVCIMNGEKYCKPFGSVFGFSCKADLLDAVKCSFFESLRNILAYLKGKIRPISFSSFMSLEDPGPDDHLALSFDCHYSNQISFLWGKTCDQLEDEGTGHANILGREIVIKDTFFEEVPLNFAVATCNKIIPLFFGIPVTRGLPHPLG